MKSCIILLMFSFLGLADSSCPLGGYKNKQPQFGPGCMYRCHCVDDVQCDNITGNCPRGCAAGWMGPGCQYALICVIKGDIAYSKQVLLNGSNVVINGSNATDELPTTCVGPATWVEIDLNATYRISGLVMNSRDTMNLIGYEVRVGNYSDPPPDIVPTCFKQTITHQLDPTTDVVCTTEIVGRYLLIGTPDNATTMTLCDVRVYGGRSLAYGHNGSQISTLFNNRFGSAAASRALDGNTTTSIWSSSCTHTEDEMSPWWRVNLAVVYNIERIVLFLRGDCCTDRLSGFSVSFATNSSFNLVFSHPKETPPLITEVIILNEDYAQQVQIGLNNTNKVTLTLCEVFVFGDCQDDMCGWTCNILCHCEGPIAKQNTIDANCPRGCKTGWWGYSCNHTCECICKGNLCNQRDGYCMECSQGKWGYFCDKNCINCLHGTGCGASDGICSVGCLTGLFGINCTEQCGKCADDVSCYRYTGGCIHGCLPGWQERNCNIACPLGSYGINCSNICGHCANATCDHIKGTCPFGCSDGYNGTRCYEPCPVGSYGINCSNKCGHCANTTCDHFNGTCPFGCTEGYNGTRCYERQQQEETSTESSYSLPIGIQVGGALGALGFTVMITVVAIIYWNRRKKAPETSEIEHTYDQIDSTRALHEKLSDYSKIEELGLSPVIPKENTHDKTLSEKNLIPKFGFRDNYQHYISLDDKTGELRLLSVFNSIPSPAPTKTKVTRTGRADDCIETLNKSYLFANRIPLKPKVQIDIGLIQIECIDITVERDLLLCNINLSECEKVTQMRNLQVILSAEECSFCIPSNINETLAVLKKRLCLRQGIEAFNTLINCTPDATDG